MPVHGLPQVLENALNDIMDSNSVTSWIMKGGSGYSQVSIRFKMASDSDIQQGEIKYRKEPPSRARRDKIRAATKMSHGDSKNLSSDMQSNDFAHNCDDSHQINIADDTTVYLNTAGILESPMQTSSTLQTLSPVIQVDGPLDTLSGPIPYENKIPEHDGATNVLDSEENCAGIGLHEPLQKNEFNKDSVPSTLETKNETYSCSNCSGNINEGKRCTFCSNIFLCDDCFDSGFHKQCRMFTTHFNATDMPRKPHCQGCFKLIEDIKDRSFFKCAVCPRYFQCSICKINCVHCYHIKDLTEVSVTDIT